MGIILKISDSTFESSDIKLLLIEVRDLLANDSFIKELAHFIAHPARNKGLCYEEINYRALVLQQGIWRENSRPLFKWLLDFFTIKKDVFEIITGIALKKKAIRDLENGKKAKEIDEKGKRSFLLSSYEFDKKRELYTIKDMNTAQEVASIIWPLINEVNLIPLITGDELIMKFDSELKNIIRKNMPSAAYNDSILRNGNDILACIFHLFQDAQLKTFEDSGARLIICPDRDADNPLFDERTKEYEIQQYKESRLALLFNTYIHGANIMTPFISSKINAGDYLTDDFIKEHISRLDQYKAIQPPPKEFVHLLDDVQLKRNDQGKLKFFRD